MGARMARGRYLIFSDAEILHMREGIESLVACAHAFERDGIPDILLNVMRINLQIRVFPSETKDMDAFTRYSRQCEWIDGRNENMAVPALCFEQNAALIPREFFWRIGGYDEVGFPGWGFNNHDLCLRVAEANGHVTSFIERGKSGRRLVCFHNYHDSPASQEEATKEFKAKWGQPFEPAMVRERLQRSENARRLSLENYDGKVKI